MNYLCFIVLELLFEKGVDKIVTNEASIDVYCCCV